MALLDAGMGDQLSQMVFLLTTAVMLISYGLTGRTWAGLVPVGLYTLPGLVMGQRGMALLARVILPVAALEVLALLAVCRSYRESDDRDGAVRARLWSAGLGLLAGVLAFATL